jgi:hypothetical protein
MHTLLLTTGRRAAFLAASSCSKKMMSTALIARPAGFVCLMDRRFFGAQQLKVKDGNDSKEDHYDDSSRRFFGKQQQKAQVKNVHHDNDSKNRFSKDEYRRFLDRLMAKTTKMESSLESLKETASRNASTTGTTPMDPSKMDAFFEESGKHKQDISQELTEIQSLLRGFSGAGAGGNKKLYAVDAPDGDCDGHVLEELEEVAHIIDDESRAAATKSTNPIEDENKRKVKEQPLKQRASDPEHW